jgi:hypothetical protein
MPVAVLFTFLRSICVPMLTLTLACSYMILKEQTSQLLLPFLILKIFVDGLLYYFWYQLRGHQLYFYYNLGIRKRLLFGFATIVDLVSFFVLQSITILLWL